MPETAGSPRYDLEDRTFAFARDCRAFVKRLPRTICNIEDVKQLVRSSGSVGANYIEANEALSRKDFKYRIRVCRKEAKESAYWLRLLDTQDSVDSESERRRLIQGANELKHIFGAIATKQ